MSFGRATRSIRKSTSTGCPSTLRSARPAVPIGLGSIFTVRASGPKASTSVWNSNFDRNPSTRPASRGPLGRDGQDPIASPSQNLPIIKIVSVNREPAHRSFGGHAELDRDEAFSLRLNGHFAGDARDGDYQGAGCRRTVRRQQLHRNRDGLRPV